MFIGKSTEISAKSARETQRIAVILAKEILKMPHRKKAFVLALAGNLGAGKTTFLQGFAKGLGVKGKINSPTFVIMKRSGTFYHLDCYRIQKPKDILDLGLKEILNNPRNVIAIEWADKIKKIIPKETIWIDLKFINNKTRKITIR